MEIYLLRHAETEANKKGCLSSHADDMLTDRGLEQANNIVDELNNLNAQSILCSPYPRAIQTIMPFSNSSSLEIEVHPCLAEGQLVLESSLLAEPPEYSGGYPIKNETKGQFIGRSKQAVELILNQEKDTVLVVSHGHMIRELLNILLNTTHKVRFPHANCGLSCVSIGKNPVVQYINHVLCSRK